ncbi:MAG: 7-cyano-7-deazaguanine synthase [Candidatus Aminicenantes bacterium]|nr:7-cyano-7-deazaguanine synthase [Candidatus Aminicenantes bacterium]
MGPIKNEVAVMFSGGIDSLLAAVLLQKEFDKVHLITFDKGYLEFGVKNNLPNVERLQATYGKDKITHQVIDHKEIIKRIAVSSFLKNRKKYNAETRWCVGCRLSMNTGGLLFALENDLVGYADGSNREQIPAAANLTGTAENYPSVVNGAKKFAREYGVHFMTPTYEFGSREDRRTKLKELGYDIDYLSLDESKKLSGLVTKGLGKRSQPICFSGWLIHWKRNLFGKMVEQNESMTVDYVTSKQNGIVREVIRDYFADKGIDIDQLVRARKADPRGKFEPIFV